MCIPSIVLYVTLIVTDFLLFVHVPLLSVHVSEELTHPTDNGAIVRGPDNMYHHCVENGIDSEARHEVQYTVQCGQVSLGPINGLPSRGGFQLMMYSDMLGSFVPGDPL